MPKLQHLSYAQNWLSKTLFCAPLPLPMKPWGPGAERAIRHTTRLFLCLEAKRKPKRGQAPRMSPSLEKWTTRRRGSQAECLGPSAGLGTSSSSPSQVPKSLVLSISPISPRLRVWAVSVQEVQARGPEVILVGCSGALEKARSQFPRGYRWAPTLSTKGGGTGYPDSLQGRTREQESRGKWRPDGPRTAEKILDESELPKVQAGMATNPNSAGHRTWGFWAHWTLWG